MPINDALLNKMMAMFKEHGYDMNKNDLVNKLNLTSVPSDAFMSTVYLRKAQYLSKDYDEEYYCFMCGKAYDDPAEFLQCMQTHIVDAMANVPIERTDEHIDWVASQLHPSMQEVAKAHLKAGNEALKKKDKK